MQRISKISITQLYALWKNLSVSLLVLIFMFSFSKLLPPFLSPVISLICAAFIYTMLYNHRTSGKDTCMVMPYTIFYGLVVYSLVSAAINVANLWSLIEIPSELLFFSGQPYIPSLIFNPTMFVVLIVIYSRRKRLRVCVDCRMRNGDALERGRLGAVLSHESHLQLRNLTIMFGVLSAVIWIYFLAIYVNINQNARDWYIFTWLTIITFVIDEVYFMFRYYNLYLDLKEHDEIATPDDIRDMTAKTQLRFYVICGNFIYVDPHAINPDTPYREIIDTPFQTKRSVGGITVGEVKDIIKRMTGVDDGELRFFYGRRSSDFKNQSLLRYFYFLPGKHEDYPKLNATGEWMDYEEIKMLYSQNPGKLAPLSVTDTTRLATIILTEKIFDSKGFRKSKIKNYQPSFNLLDVYNSRLDFQDDKWIHISMFNSDMRFFKIKRWWRRLTGRGVGYSR